MRKLAAAIRHLWRFLIRKCTERLVNKLILLFSVVLVLVVVSLTFISYKMIEQVSVDHGITGNQSTLRLVNKNIAGYFREIEELSLPGMRYDALMSALHNEPEDYEAKRYLENYMRTLFYSRADIEAVFLYLLESQKYYAISHTDPGRTIKVHYDDAGSVPKQPWFAAALADERNRHIQSLLADGTSAEAGYRYNREHSYMAYHRVFRNLADRRPKAVLTLVFNPSVRDEILQDISVGEGEHLLLMDPVNRPFYWDDRDFYLMQREKGFFSAGEPVLNGGGTFTWNAGKKRYMIIVDVEASEGWKLVKSVPYDRIYHAAHTNRLVSTGIGFGFLLLSLVLVTLTSNAITRPLMNLARKMEIFGQGEFLVEARVKGRDEIAWLAGKFNEMVARINELINERYKSKLAEKNAILKALETEINPHFLYNALQAISTRALKRNAPEVADMVDALAMTLRYTISGKDRMRLHEELRHVENYLKLQKARFGDRLRVVFELDDSVRDLEVPKLSVQTLVENAIKHGVEKVSSTVTIVIEARAEGERAVITVRDDGPGMLPEQLDAILQSFRVDWEEWKGRSIGLKNLHTRLKLIYGEQSDLIIETSEAGTSIRILIPARGGEPDVQGADRR